MHGVMRHFGFSPVLTLPTIALPPSLVDARDTVQAKLVELGLFQPDASGAGWELTQQGCELLSATLTHLHKSKLAADLLTS